jgi:hypothetical protein
MRVLGAGVRTAKVSSFVVVTFHIVWIKAGPILECLKLTNAMQKTCETLQNVADLYDDHVSMLQKTLNRFFLLRLIVIANFTRQGERC